MICPLSCRCLCRINGCVDTVSPVWMEYHSLHQSLPCDKIAVHRCCQKTPTDSLKGSQSATLSRCSGRKAPLDVKLLQAAEVMRSALLSCWQFAGYADLLVQRLLRHTCRAGDWAKTFWQASVFSLVSCWSSACNAAKECELEVVQLSCSGSAFCLS